MIAQIRLSSKRLALGLLLAALVTFAVAVKLTLLETLLAYGVFVGVAVAPVLLAELLMRDVCR
jgi:hypothetical protein